MTHEKRIILYVTRGMLVVALVSFGLGLPVLTAGSVMCGLIGFVGLQSKI